MSVAVAGAPAHGSGARVPRLDFELTPSCDHRCAHCYNVWTASDGDPQAGYDVRGQLETAGLKALMTKAVTQSGATHLTLTGGEPLLRKDALELVAHAATLVPSVVLITNGSHVTPEVAAALAAARVRSVQLTLLAGDRELHDRLKGATCFDDTVRAAVTLADHHVPTQCCYVAMSENAGELEGVLELCVALGIRSLSYNRMSPTGGAVHHVQRLLPAIDGLEGDLATLERLGRAWGIEAATAMPLPPCLVRYERYPWVRFGTCSTTSDSPNLVIDGKGNVRSCNLSSRVLGNLRTQEWAEIWPSPYVATFAAAVPEVCRGCAQLRSCQSGCKESAHATFGDHAHPEPLLWAALQPTAAWPVPQSPHDVRRKG
ncbi:MAG: radical SAM protein [Myxococcota bacterium]